MFDYYQIWRSHPDLAPAYINKIVIWFTMSRQKERSSSEIEYV